MAEYSDLEQINSLYAQSRHVAQAINNLDAGGSPTSVTIAPPPSSESAMPPLMPMVVSITLPGPFSDELLVEIREKLVGMESDLARQLQALGVTATPPART